MSTVKFEATGLGMDDPLGLWAASPAQETAVHFGIGDEPTAPPPDVPVYRIQLPANFADANSAFNEQEARLAASAKALDDVPARLEGLVARTQAPASSDGQVHFGIGDEAPAPEAPAEASLLALLGEAEGAGAAKDSDQVHFGIVDETISPALEQAKAQFDALLEQVNREVLHFAWVETVITGKTLARTTIGWSGDAQTIWVKDVTPEQITLHNRTIHFATRSRALKMQMVFTIAGGASQIAVLMGSGNVVLAMPVVYKYVREIISQVRQLQELPR
jgi:hypothetical protein